MIGLRLYVHTWPMWITGLCPYACIAHKCRYQKCVLIVNIGEGSDRGWVPYLFVAVWWNFNNFPSSMTHTHVLSLSMQPAALSDLPRQGVPFINPSNSLPAHMFSTSPPSTHSHHHQPYSHIRHAVVPPTSVEPYGKLSTHSSAGRKTLN